MATKTRNRVIYQSEALYVGQPSSTGCHFNATIAEDSSVPANDTSSKLFGLVKILTLSMSYASLTGKIIGQRSANQWIVILTNGQRIKPTN